MRRVPLAYYDLELHPSGLVCVRRNTKDYPSVEAVASAYEELLTAVDVWRNEPDAPSVMGWIYDVRAAPAPPSDRGFEAVHNRYRPELFARSTVLIVLVATASGMKQMSRLGREDKSRFEATTDENMARSEALTRIAELRADA